MPRDSRKPQDKSVNTSRKGSATGQRPPGTGNAVRFLNGSQHVPQPARINQRTQSASSIMMNPNANPRFSRPNKHPNQAPIGPPPGGGPPRPSNPNYQQSRNATHAPHRVPITTIEHHLDSLNHQQGVISSQTLDYLRCTKELALHSNRHNAKFAELGKVVSVMDHPTYELMHFQRQKVDQISSNFRSVFKANLPTQKELNQQHAKVVKQIPELEKRLRKKRLEFHKNQTVKLKNDLDQQEQLLKDYRYRAQNPRKAQGRSELIHGVMQEVVLPGCMDFAYRQQNYHNRWHQNLHTSQTKQFSTSCTLANFEKERTQIFADLQQLDIVDKQEPHDVRRKGSSSKARK